MLPNFEVDAALFIETLTALSRASGGKSNLTRGKVRLHAHGGLVSIHAANGVSGAGTVLPATVKREGGAIVEHAPLTGLFSGVKGALLVGEKAGKLHFRAGTTRMSLAWMDAEEFPETPSGDGQIVQMPFGEFETLLHQGGFAYGGKQAKPIFQGIHIHSSGGVGFVESSDSYRIARAEIVTGNGQYDVLVDGRHLYDITRLLASGEDDDLSLTFARNHLLLERGAWNAHVTLIEGKFPDLARIVPTDAPARFSANRAAVLDALKRVRVTDADGDEMWLHSKANKVAFTSNGGTSDAQVVVEATTNGEYEICLSDRYLAAALESLPEDEFTFQSTDRITPILIKNARQTYVVLPINRRRD